MCFFYLDGCYAAEGFSPTPPRPMCGSDPHGARQSETKDLPIVDLNPPGTMTNTMTIKGATRSRRTPYILEAAEDSEASLSLLICMDSYFSCSLLNRPITRDLS